MEALAGYRSDDDNEQEEEQEQMTLKHWRPSAAIDAAPLVMVDLKSSQQCIDPSFKTVFTNPTADTMWQPVQGPVTQHALSQFGDSGLGQGLKKNAVTGYVERAYVDQFVFDEQFNTFESLGYAHDPSENGVEIIGDKEKAAKFAGQLISSSAIKHSKEVIAERSALKAKRKAETGNVADVDSFRGPWAPLYEEKREEVELTDEQKAYIKEKQEKARKVEWVDESIEESSEFHGGELYDYQGRSFIHPPAGSKPAPPDLKNYIPKKLLHTWYGHTKGVNAIMFFPVYGHLLLSCSMDGTAKIWDVYGQRKCIRTYKGHTESVRCIDFNADGTKFLTASYDRWVKVWDTETGKVLSRHTSRKIPYVAKFHPHRDNEILVGQSNKKIVQWNCEKNTIMQNYDDHLGQVNTITFVDNARRFISTSDDKKVLIWEYGIPVVLKQIAEPDMHSMPFVALHPSGKFWAGQSQDNQILIYGALNRFKQNMKKRFLGHLCAGYAAQVGFSPDGRYVISGDAEGRCFFWDWKTGKIFTKLKAHDQVTIGCVWHPTESSKVVTCSWDGTIKLWD